MMDNVTVTIPEAHMTTSNVELFGEAIKTALSRAVENPEEVTKCPNVVYWLDEQQFMYDLNRLEELALWLERHALPVAKSFSEKFNFAVLGYFRHILTSDKELSSKELLNKFTVQPKVVA